MTNFCNICHEDGAKYYGTDPNEPGWEYWYCDKCARLCITPTGEPIKERIKP